MIQEVTSLNPAPPGTHNLIDIARFSSLSKLISVTAIVLRFIQNTRQSITSRIVGPLTLPELTTANLKWLHDVQHTMFPDEVTNLQSSGNRSQLVRQLRLFLDCNNLLRCGGRIHNAPLEELAKFPYLLPSRHPLIWQAVCFKNTSLRPNLNKLYYHCSININLTLAC